MPKNVFQKIGKKMKKGTKVVNKGVKKGVKKTVPKKVRKKIAKGAKKYSKTYNQVDKSLYKSAKKVGLGHAYRTASYFNPLGTTKTISDVASGKKNIVRGLASEFTPYGDYQVAKGVIKSNRDLFL